MLTNFINLSAEKAEGPGEIAENFFKVFGCNHRIYSIITQDSWGRFGSKIINMGSWKATQLCTL